jgi:hypothetical protein
MGSAQFFAPCLTVPVRACCARVCARACVRSPAQWLLVGLANGGQWQRLRDRRAEMEERGVAPTRAVLTVSLRACEHPPDAAAAEAVVAEMDRRGMSLRSENYAILFRLLELDDRSDDAVTLARSARAAGVWADLETVDVRGGLVLRLFGLPTATAIALLRAQLGDWLEGRAPPHAMRLVSGMPVCPEKATPKDVQAGPGAAAVRSAGASAPRVGLRPGFLESGTQGMFPSIVALFVAADFPARIDGPGKLRIEADDVERWCKKQRRLRSAIAAPPEPAAGSANSNAGFSSAAEASAGADFPGVAF